MNPFSKSARASLALAAIASLLAGCSGGGSQSTMPKAPVVASGPATVASGQNLVRGTLTLDMKQLENVLRSKQTIPGTATTATVFVAQAPANAGGAQYFPVASCVALPAPGVGPATIPFAAPVGYDWVVVAVSTGACAAATTLPAPVVTAFTNASNNSGTWSLPTSGPVTVANLSTVQVAGTEGTGTWLTVQSAGIPGNPFTVNPGGGIAAGPINLGYSLSTPQTLTGASLSTSTPGVTAFEMDAAGVYGLPFNFSVNSPSGAVPASGASCNPVTNAGACNNFDQPVTVRVKDTSVNAAGTATAGVLTLWLVSSTGATLGGPTATALGAAGCSGTQACATITIGSALPPGASFVVTYTGANQDVFQQATATISYAGGTLASFPITNQTQVVTLAQQGANKVLPAGNPSAAVNPVGPLGITEAGDPTVAGGSVYVADGPNVWWSGGVAATPFTTNQITFNVADPAPAGTVLGAIADGGVYVGGTVFVADANCIACSNTKTGLYSRAANAAGLTNFTTPAGQSMFQATVLPPFSPGPIGIAYWTVAGGAPANGVLFVAANNSIYRIVINTATTATSVSLFAGTGIAGTIGAGNVNGPGLAAQFNFGTSKFVPMALNYNPNGGAVAPTALYVLDTGNGAVRAISLSGSNAVTTLIAASAGHGLTYDSGNGLLYITNNNNTVAAINPTTGTAAGFAGQINVAGSGNGLGIAAYPVQFNAGNAVSAAAGGPPPAGSTFSGLGLTANSNAAAQNAVGVASFLATFSNPVGIVYDPNKAFFYVVDNTTAAIRTLY
ncbi:MAG: hypothetical protein JO140_02545 [Candidatus Eremiobacteraeota bacterium]|nr:hypothetical protein [Candidatus Eremiobacteraeota bacterium]